MAEGVIYDMFNYDEHIVTKLPRMVRHWVGVDYGTNNPTVFLHLALGEDDRLYVCKEYYHSGKDSLKQKSPSEYADDFVEWLDNLTDSEGFAVSPEHIFIDPSAQGFILELWRRNVKRIAKADNDVLMGIGLVSSIMSTDHFRVHKSCNNLLKELSTYVWDEKAQERGEDKPMKESDHTLDVLRYVANGTRTVWLKKGIIKE